MFHESRGPQYYEALKDSFKRVFGDIDGVLKRYQTLLGPDYDEGALLEFGERWRNGRGDPVNELDQRLRLLERELKRRVPEQHDQMKRDFARFFLEGR
jgi:hypothetical protein